MCRSGIRYDNLTSEVTAVVFGQGRQRQENDRWVLFRSFYGFVYCQPGIGGAHEKDGVEGEVGWFRRNRLSPMPVVESLKELNARIRAWEVQDEHRRIMDRIHTIGEDFANEQPFLHRWQRKNSILARALTPTVSPTPSRSRLQASRTIRGSGKKFLA